MANNTALYGFIGSEHLFGDRVTTLNSSVVETAINESVAEYNRQKNEALSMFVRRTTDYQALVNAPKSGTLQALDNLGWGNPEVSLETGHYTVAWPIQAGGDAYGLNRVSRAMITVGEVNREVGRIMRNDADWTRRHVLAAILDSSEWTFTDPLYGDLTIKPLANADSTTYVFTGGSAAATDNHYLYTSGSGVAADFQTLYEELSEHPANGLEPVVCFVPTANVTYIEAQTGFVAADIPGITVGDNTSRFTADQARFRGPGDIVRGQQGRCVIVEWKALPTDYCIAVALGAEAALGQREYPEAALQGLFQEGFMSDGNWGGTRFLRYCGFGAWNRVGVAVLKLGAGSYSVPSGYDAPLSV